MLHRSTSSRRRRASRSSASITSSSSAPQSGLLSQAGARGRRASLASSEPTSEALMTGVVMDRQRSPRGSCVPNIALDNDGSSSEEVIMLTEKNHHLFLFCSAVFFYYVLFFCNIYTILSSVVCCFSLTSTITMLFNHAFFKICNFSTLIILKEPVCTSIFNLKIFTCSKSFLN